MTWDFSLNVDVDDPSSDIFVAGLCLLETAMSEARPFLDFATNPAFQWIALTVGVLGAAFGIIAWLDGRRKDRVYKYLFEAAEKNIDKNLTDEQIKFSRSEAARASEQIEELRKRIETEIPLEAKRTVLKDRIDANIVTLQATLTSTLELRNQLSALGETPDIPRELLKAVEAEVLPEYVRNSQRETLKTYLIIVTSISALTSAVIPWELSLIIQIPLLVVGVSLLTRLFKEYASKLSQTADPSTLKMIAAALYAGALTTGVAAFLLERERLPAHRWDRMDDRDWVALVMITISIMLIGLCAWLIKTKRRWPWRLLSAALAILGIAVALLSALLLSKENQVGEFAAAYIFALFSAVMVLTAVYMQVRLKRITLKAGGSSRPL